MIFVIVKAGIHPLYYEKFLKNVEIFIIIYP